MNLVSALHALATFDHGACDALVRSRHIEFQYFGFKGSSFEGLVVGPIFLTLWSIAIVWATARAYRRGRALERRYRAWTWFGPLMGLVAVFGWNAIVRGVIEYADTCTRLLHAGP